MIDNKMKISFVFILNKINKNEIIYWNKISKKLINKGHQFIVINNDLKNILESNLFEESKIINNKGNISKFNSILKVIKICENPNIKIVNPSDYISIKKIDEVCNQLNGNFIYRMNSFKKEKDFKNKEQRKIEDFFSKNLYTREETLKASWTIFPKKAYEKIDKNITKLNIKIDEDQLLGQIALSKGFDVKDIFEGFYLYINGNKSLNKKKLNSYLDNAFETIEAYSYLQYKYKYLNPVNWPNISYYKKTINSSFENLINPNSKNNKKLKDIFEISSLKLKINNKEDINQEMNICFISDKNQYIYSITNAFIILNQVNLNKKIKIYLIFFDLNTKQQNIAKKIIDEMKLNSKIELLFILEDEFPQMESKISHITKATNIRLFLPNILLNVDNILYLDNDTFVKGDISSIFSIFEKDKSYARRWNQNSSWVKQMKKKNFLKNKYYYNVGIIHLPLKKMREENFTQKAISFYEKNKNKIKYADQDILNSLLEINDMPWFLNIAREKWPKLFKWMEMELNVKIYHFISENKQWNKEFEILSKETGSLTKEEINKLLPYKEEWNLFYDKIKRIIE